MSLKLTTQGYSLLQRTIAGETAINFQSIAIGNGADAGQSATSLNNMLMDLQITSVETDEAFITLRSVYNNASVDSGFRCTEIGVFADDPDDPGEVILYAYGYTPEADADYVPSNASRVLETQLDVLVYIGDAENVTATINQSLVYATQAELAAHTGNQTNPHSVSAVQVGLGNVPNVSTNDQTPTWTAANSLAGLTSGERLSVAFGKIAKSILSLIGHLDNRSNPHAVTAAQIGAARSSHQHAATDINAGVLSAERGGTGQSTLKKAATSFLLAQETFTVASSMGFPLRNVGYKNSRYDQGGTWYCEGQYLLPETIDTWDYAHIRIEATVWGLYEQQLSGDILGFSPWSEDELPANTSRLLIKLCQSTDSKDIFPNAMLPQTVTADICTANWAVVMQRSGYQEGQPMTTEIQSPDSTALILSVPRRISGFYVYSRAYGLQTLEYKGMQLRVTFVK